MKLLRRSIGLFRDSPTFGQDRANLLSGLTVGTTGLLLNAAVFLFVLPLMLDPDGSGYRAVTENVEFGQVLALILLGGATVLATLLIPLRLVTVFLGPRTGNFFDQIVLSGITPLRYVIGKATSQNMFLCLVIFLLLPWFVLSLTLGGVDPVTFAAGLFLVWLYCMMLALMTLWCSLYVNEVMAALLVICGATFFGLLGCMPIWWQPFVVTPMAALLQPVYSAMPSLNGSVTSSYGGMFLASTGAMTSLCLSRCVESPWGPCMASFVTTVHLAKSSSRVTALANAGCV